MPRKARDVERALRSKGFQLRKSTHRRFIYFNLEGKKTTVRTEISHGEREIHDSLLAAMARQCLLQRDEFYRLIDCPLDQPAYDAMVKERTSRA
jgi:predicted RNA binding protein YcfA (HicA-like mRNA interferase family)